MRRIGRKGGWAICYFPLTSYSEMQLLHNVRVCMVFLNSYHGVRCYAYKGAFRNPVLGFPRQTWYTIRRNLISLRVRRWKRRFTTKIIFHKRTVPLSPAADLQGHETSVSHRSPQSIKNQRCTHLLLSRVSVGRVCGCTRLKARTRARTVAIKR